jgi:ankyrin repeat protein
VIEKGAARMTAEVFTAAREGDVARLVATIDRDASAIDAREPPYDWTLLHAAAHAGQAAVVEMLLARGLDPNTREKGDDTYAMHWAAAAGRADIVRMLTDAGGDVVGHGDDHALEVIGWATCWDGCDDDAHRAVVDLLLARGARHHIFSAVAFGLGEVVRDIVRARPEALHQTLSRNENFELPLQFAVRKNKLAMVELLLSLGADPHATDGVGMSSAEYAADPRVDMRILEVLASRMPESPFLAITTTDAGRPYALVGVSPATAVERGVLHLLAKRGDLRGVEWLLDRGADANARWEHWGSTVTPLHLAVLGDHPGVVRVLLARGADATIRDTLHDSDAAGWAEYMGRNDVLKVLRRD